MSTQNSLSQYGVPTYDLQGGGKEDRSFYQEELQETSSQAQERQLLNLQQPGQKKRVSCCLSSFELLNGSFWAYIHHC